MLKVLLSKVPHDSLKGARETVQQLRKVTALAEDQGSSLRTNIPANESP